MSIGMTCCLEEIYTNLLQCVCGLFQAFDTGFISVCIHCPIFCGFVDITIAADWCSKAYLIISGATDGAIAIWDITDSVVTFSRQATSSSLLNLGTVQTPLRPKKGRGSQGGRRWQNSRHSQKPRNVKTDKDMFDGVLMVTSEDIKTSKIHNCNEDASDLQKSVCVEGEPICSIVDEGNTTESMETHKASVLQPIHIFARVHQSGVNCLSVSRVVAGEGLVFALASGGDDQALHVRKFRVIGDSKGATCGFVAFS